MSFSCISSTIPSGNNHNPHTTKTITPNYIYSNKENLGSNNNNNHNNNNNEGFYLSEEWHKSYERQLHRRQEFNQMPFQIPSDTEVIPPSTNPTKHDEFLATTQEHEDNHSRYEGSSIYSSQPSSSSLMNAPESTKIAVIKKLLYDDNPFAIPNSSIVNLLRDGSRLTMKSVINAEINDKPSQQLPSQQQLHHSNLLREIHHLNHAQNSYQQQQSQQQLLKQLIQLKANKQYSATLATEPDENYQYSTIQQHQSQQQQQMHQQQHTDTSLIAMNRNFQSRNLTWNQAKNKRLAQTRKLHTENDLENETKECTFTPAISEKSRQLLEERQRRPRVQSHYQSSKCINTNNSNNNNNYMITSTNSNSNCGNNSSISNNFSCKNGVNSVKNIPTQNSISSKGNMPQLNSYEFKYQQRILREKLQSFEINI